MKKALFNNACKVIMASLGLAIALPLLAADSGTINYQARLLDSFGRRVNDTVDLSFKIYDAATDGNLLWSETHSGVTVQDGVYAVVLGSQTPIPAAVFAQNNVYLELGIDSQTMAPRQQMTAAAYALVARTVMGSNIFENQSNDYVGIGTTNPAVKLDVNGTVNMLGFKMPTGATANYVLVSDADGNGTWEPMSVVLIETDPIFTNWVNVVYNPSTNSMWAAIAQRALITDVATATNDLWTAVGQRVLISTYTTATGNIWTAISARVQISDYATATNNLWTAIGNRMLRAGDIMTGPLTNTAGFYGNGIGLTNIPTGSIVLTNYVQRTGDTMTGPLVISNNLTVALTNTAGDVVATNSISLRGTAITNWDNLTGSLNVAVGNLNSSTNTLQSQATALQGATGTLNIATNTLQVQATALQGATNTLNTATNTLQVQATALQGATNSLNIRAGDLETSTNTLQIQVTALQGATNTLNTATNTLQVQATALQGATNSLNTRADNLEASTNALNTRANSLETSTNNLNTRATALENATNSLNANKLSLVGGIMTGPLTNNAGFFGNGAGLTNVPVESLTGYVQKIGDTMTGILTVSNNLVVTLTNQAGYFVATNSISLRGSIITNWGDTSPNLASLSNDVSALQDATNALNTRAGNLETATNALNTRADNLEASTNALNTRANSLETSTNNLNTRATALENATNSLNANKLSLVGGIMTGPLTNTAGYYGNGRGLTNLSPASLIAGQIPATVTNSAGGGMVAVYSNGVYQSLVKIWTGTANVAGGAGQATFSFPGVFSSVYSLSAIAVSNATTSITIPLVGVKSYTTTNAVVYVVTGTTISILGDSSLANAPNGTRVFLTVIGQ